MIAGLSPDTVLGRVVAIRSETDKEAIKHFTKDQRRIYDEWRTREANVMDERTFEAEMASLEALFANMCGGGQELKR